VSLPSPAKRAAGLFRDAFGMRPALVVSAPGRVNLAGEHTDYNGGPVLPVAIERRTAVAVGAAPPPRFELVSEGYGSVEAVDACLPPRGAWTDYVVGVVRALAEIGAAPSGARLAAASSIPAGAGLASSAALAVAAARALSLLARRQLGPHELIDAAFRAEHDHVGVPCGRMDQSSAVLARAGSALLLETATGALERLPFRGRIWLVETGVSRRLGESGYAARRRECAEALALCRERWPALRYLAEVAPEDLPTVSRLLPPPLAARVRHVVGETARARAAARALAAGDLAALGRLWLESHASLRDEYASSVREADLIVAAAARHGAYGARLIGGGWGGVVAVLVPPEREPRVLAELARECRTALGRAAEIWSSRAGSGVRREAVPAT